MEFERGEVVKDSGKPFIESLCRVRGRWSVAEARKACKACTKYVLGAARGRVWADVRGTRRAQQLKATSRQHSSHLVAPFTTHRD